MNARGFSLIEASIALAILATGVMLAADLAIRSSSSLSYDNRMSLSLQISSALMEELSSTFASDARLTIGTHTQYYNVLGVAVAAPDVYTATWTIKTKNNVTNIIEIDLQVQWTGSSNTGILLSTFRGSS